MDFERDILTLERVRVVGVPTNELVAILTLNHRVTLVMLPELVFGVTDNITSRAGQVTSWAIITTRVSTCIPIFIRIRNWNGESTVITGQDDPLNDSRCFVNIGVGLFRRETRNENMFTQSSILV